VLGQCAAVTLVVGTWLVSRYRSRRKNAQRRASAGTNGHAVARPCESMQQTGVPACDRAADDCCATGESCETGQVSDGVPVELRVLSTPRSAAAETHSPEMQIL
jgi:hypothetical protein